MHLVNGSFRVMGAPLDGDRIRFYPDDPAAVRAVGSGLRVNSDGGVVVRLEGLDALEGHYVPPGGRTVWRQAGDLVSATGSSLLTALGFRRAEPDGTGVVTASVPEQVRGHVLTRSVDCHGRVVGFAFPGRRRGRAQDLARVTLGVKGLRDSVNWVLLRQGLAFPAFYSRLYPQLRTELAAAAGHARDRDRGVWPRDVTRSGLRIAGRDQLRSGNVMAPKLFRRLSGYLELETSTDGVSLAAFVAYLRARADELFTIPDGRTTQLDGVVEVRRNVVRLTIPPELIVFRER